MSNQTFGSLIASRVRSNISTECYKAVVDHFVKKFPGAHFEDITNTEHSPLGPSDALLSEYKAGKIGWLEYKTRLEVQISSSYAAQQRLRFLFNLATRKDTKIFLICYEKDPTHCHRSIVKELIARLWRG